MEKDSRFHKQDYIQSDNKHLRLVNLEAQECPTFTMSYDAVGVWQYDSKLELFFALFIVFRSIRPVDVEPVFANIKHNKGFRRFNLRRKRKVEVEKGL